MKQIQVFSFGSRRVIVRSTGGRFGIEHLAPSLAQCWAQKHKEGWMNSWLPALSSFEFGVSSVFFDAGVMRYGEYFCLDSAMRESVPGAPSVLPGIAIAIIVKTLDGFVLFAKRNPELVAGNWWNFPGGSMNSLLLDRARCEDESFSRDPRLFDLQEQLRRRVFAQEFPELKEADVSFAQYPCAVAITRYVELGWIVEVRKTRQELESLLRGYEYRAGQKEHTKISFVHVSELDVLLRNQARWVKDDPDGDESDPLNIPLIDLNVAELVGGAFEQLTGRALPADTLAVLEQSGLMVNVHNPKLGVRWEFPAEDIVLKN